MNYKLLGGKNQQPSSVCSSHFSVMLPISLPQEEGRPVYHQPQSLTAVETCGDVHAWSQWRRVVMCMRDRSGDAWWCACMIAVETCGDVHAWSVMTPQWEGASGWLPPGATYLELRATQLRLQQLAELLLAQLELLIVLLGVLLIHLHQRHDGLL